MSKRKKKKKYIPPILDQEYQGCIDLEGTKLRVRLIPSADQLDFGVEKDFDRWANSTDFSTNIPTTLKQWSKKLQNISKLIPQYQQSEDWETQWI